MNKTIIGNAVEKLNESVEVLKKLFKDNMTAENAKQIEAIEDALITFEKKQYRTHERSAEPLSEDIELEKLESYRPCESIIKIFTMQADFLRQLNK